MNRLKNLFTEYDIDGYIIPKNDEYFNEYTDNSKDRLKFISNFSGSAGFAIIFKNKKYLFVDGRYTIQAKKQSYKNFRVITFPDKFPKDILKFKKSMLIGFDPKLHTERQVNFLFKFKNIILKPINDNLVDKIWFNKPKEKVKKFFFLPNSISGKSANKKIFELKKYLNKNKYDFLFISAPENVAWILNIRGNDSLFSPITNARLLIDKKGRLDLFTNLKKISGIVKMLNKKIFLHEENKIDEFISKISNKTILLDNQSCSIHYKKVFEKKNRILFKMDPTYKLKAIKNKTEIKNIKRIHLIDGIALTKFILWLKKNFKNTKITEISAQNKLESFRKKHLSYKYPSFSTISGSGPNSAIIHYVASLKTNRTLKSGELYLVDSGGQYSFGTTDVTRTISLDNKSTYIKDIFTRVLKGHIAVSNFKINKNTTGSQIDKNARKFLKKIKLDYPHGTGHGVGYFLNVHEGPHSISKNSKITLQNGMVLSNEPGYYKENHFGIRIENLVYINKNKFEELTVAPIEKSLINKKILSSKELEWINNYHKKVEKNLSRYIDFEDKSDFKKACLPI
tara:strand:+ start:2143 stop:3843 length:1701 start_codon:yes stop_codon:yes gene_type:complete